MSIKQFAVYPLICPPIDQAGHAAMGRAVLDTPPAHSGLGNAGPIAPVNSERRKAAPPSAFGGARKAEIERGRQSRREICVNSLCRSVVLVIMLAGATRAGPAPFDLAGPVIEVKVTRGAVTLPIAEVPNLAASDQIWIRADLPPSQSTHYLMVAAFERIDESAARGVVLPLQDVDGQMRARWAYGDRAAGSAASALVSCARNRRRLQNFGGYRTW